jgi:uncharacterized membrane protein
MIKGYLSESLMFWGFSIPKCGVLWGIKYGVIWGILQYLYDLPIAKNPSLFQAKIECKHQHGLLQPNYSTS